MRKIGLFLIAVTICLFACKQSNEGKAKSLIKEYMKQNLHDFKSYEPVDFSELRNAFSDIYYDTEFLSLEKDYDRLKGVYEKYSQFEHKMASYGVSRKELQVYRSQTDSVINLQRENLKKREEIYNSFDFNKKIGLKLTHSYRAKTLGGNLKLTTRVFVFDDELTRIIRSYEDE